MRVCLVKQRSCYDLYTEAGSDVRRLAPSTALRSGPLGLWEWPGAEVTFRVVSDCEAPECRRGPAEWAPFVAGKEFPRYRGEAEDPAAVDWDQYDVVISIDVAVPGEVVRRHPGVLWCHYFIEGGTWGADEQWADAPQYGYNVFLTQRPARQALTPRSLLVRRFARTRRARLDVPYYLLSDQTLQRIYGGRGERRQGVCLASGSRGLASERLRRELAARGPLRDDYRSPAELHAAMAVSRFFVVTPGTPARTGGALVDAVAAGCVVLAPRETVRAFTDLLVPWLEFADEDGLLACLDLLESDPGRWAQARAWQAHHVRRCFWELPLRHLALLREVLPTGTAAVARQRRAERRAAALAPLRRLALRARRRLRRAALSR